MGFDEMATCDSWESWGWGVSEEECNKSIFMLRFIQNTNNNITIDIYLYLSRANWELKKIILILTNLCTSTDNVLTIINLMTSETGIIYLTLKLFV